MGLHRDILPLLVDACESIHAQCGVVLIGSVAQAAQRATSDIDLNIILPGDECPVGRSPYIAHDNRWQLKVKDHVQGIRIDVAWETEHELLRRLNGDEVINCWPFSKGEILRDPCGIARHCLEVARKWFAEHPDVVSRYESQYREAKKKQKNHLRARKDPP